ncbi:unnamed protein product [Camellia sinensis]
MPNRVSYLEYATKDEGPLGVKGYCIDVFDAAIKLLPYTILHTYTLYGDGLRNPSYNNLVNNVAQNLREHYEHLGILTSILTVQQLTSNIERIDSLISSTDSIGVEDGSFWLKKQSPKIGAVAATVDGFLTLSSYCTRPTANLELLDKNLLKVDRDLDSPPVVDLSTTILQLLENSDLQRIHDRWISLDRYTPEDEEQDIDELESVRPKSMLRMTIFKDFVDKKDDQVMESIEQKSDSKRQASQCSNWASWFSF